jgi:hypothetical protein
MKKVLTTLLLATFLSGAVIASDLRGATRSNETTASVAGNTVHPSLLQRNNRRRWRRRWVRRRWNNRNSNDGQWNNRRWNNRRGRRGRGGHGDH